MHHGEIDVNTAKALKALGERIKAAKIPSSKLDESMTIATWNVREFGRKKRHPISLHLIAEILGQFDLTVLVELRDDVRELQQVLRYLGPYWDVLFSDFNTDHGGNNERIGYVFDTRNVQFTGLGGNTTPLRKKADGEYVPLLSWWRQPYLASFRSGNFDFVMLSAHVRWGESELARRGELEGLADWVERRVGEKVVDDLDILVAGDFNIPDTKGALFKAITKHGLQLPRALAGLDHGSNLEKNKRYDQILHLPETKGFTGRGGVLDFYCGDHKPLFPGVNLTKEKFTYELSDHLPLWLEVDTDNDEERLDALLQKPKKG